ncbi:GDP-mannose-dependent alpha-(1-6)-phosphatidylinositol monomannoside mannosyltransferase [Corynebacterium occultum]|uniref:GDP-mannose-dependent alpha-(1-6)-phosphatidylinositol monomannoside mannosyltransferase n=1 Tax=Corynebacterium occultum TaxID=2675219 RepID=A0A6B8VXP5_9CORY|nr:glycosyltransferase family 4 protein [Corynebacterium occultum]QGU07829.1 GDP-mannose-dependent alpha-(1-6)-phosphatidylinositol monomannoside mannosyltransferase [Corynebacterium occultum]
MGKTLLVTNDFPPTIGGIQSYLRDFLATLDPAEVVVFASTQDAVAATEYDRQVGYEVVRWPRRIMLPTPATTRRMAKIIREREIDTVWFGAAAPLALMAGAAREAGARRIISTTHGHEVGWSMLPIARQVLRRIGRETDVLTYISEYTLRRFRRAFGSRPRFEHLPSGVDVELFRPLAEDEKKQIRAEFGEGPLLVCISRLVPRKGQDQLIRALPEIRRRHPGTRLLIIGQGSYERTLRKMTEPLGEAVVFTGKVGLERMRSLLAAADIFAMPARTRGRGLDVEGLGIVYLEAQACGVAVIAGDSGGAPETVTPESGMVVGGRDLGALIDAADLLLSDPALRGRMGQAGREHVVASWTWERMGERLRGILA